MIVGSLLALVAAVARAICLDTLREDLAVGYPA